MGRVAKLMDFVRSVRGSANISDATCDVGGLDNRTAEHFSDSGDDSHPLPGDYSHVEPQAGSGRVSSVGYIDPKNSHKSRTGEKRIYARDPETGESIVEIWLKNDGSVVIENSAITVDILQGGSMRAENQGGYFSILSNGDFEVNGVTIDAVGNIDTPSSVSSPSVVVDGKELANHNHPAGSPPGNTGPNN